MAQFTRKYYELDMQFTSSQTKFEWSKLSIDTIYVSVTYIFSRQCKRRSYV
jgi:hypothetical protein